MNDLFLQKYGSGFIRIREALQDYPEINFEIKEFTGGVMVTFAQKQPESRPESQPESALPMEARVLRLLAMAPMGKRDISAALGQKEVSGQLNKVIRTLLDKGLIEPTIADKPNSRLQQYRLVS